VPLRSIVLAGALKYDVRWFGTGDEHRSPGATSGLVGGVVSTVAESDSSSDLVLVELLREGFGRSGALYDNMFVVWMSWTGAEILWRRIGPLAVVLLRRGALPSALSSLLDRWRRVVNARASDMVAV